ncbi:hypothetical protein SBA7_140012 [Candidatus Sulfotelmatobacter sp. SbA7]|nr:hypothetical protein SBA7_140012 [Candidatus Sulfotelmatobacter sp. SbA7]
MSRHSTSPGSDFAAPAWSKRGLTGKDQIKTQVALQRTSVGYDLDSYSHDCRRMPVPVIVLLLVPAPAWEKGLLQSRPDCEPEVHVLPGVLGAVFLCVAIRR